METLLFIAFGFCLGLIMSPLFYNKVYNMRLFEQKDIESLVKENRELMDANEKLMEVNNQLVDTNEIYLRKIEEMCSD